MTDERDPVPARQQVVRVPGSRRARLTPVDGTDTDPEGSAVGAAQSPAFVARRVRADARPAGPNDDRLMQDVPPHY
ncbi:hypothetical protein [Microbacterium sp. Root553]|uniref:hypothetical protein n=1 Tax=Microbacterium sp. Root553 TaxID=1736556 RepID=UPI0006F4B31B|nr:hypothetical protein [Microbacterium sp. Root553]KQZ22714.1 hypothetical protein ASD43_15620 [Microbacterium sp. Root553]